MINYDIKVKLKGDQKICDTAPDKNDAKLELTAACAEYVNTVAPGKKFDVKDLGNAVADFINDYLCLNPDNIPDYVQLAKIWDKLNRPFDGIANDNKWHNVKHVDKPGLKIDEWVKKYIG